MASVIKKHRILTFFRSIFVEQSLLEFHFQGATMSPAAQQHSSTAAQQHSSTAAQLHSSTAIIQTKFAGINTPLKNLSQLCLKNLNTKTDTQVIRVPGGVLVGLGPQNFLSVWMNS